MEEKWTLLVSDNHDFVSVVKECSSKEEALKELVTLMNKNVDKFRVFTIRKD